MFRRLAREAVIFMLLGLLIAAVGSFAYMHHSEAVSIRNQREAIKKGCTQLDDGGIDVYGRTRTDLSGGFVKPTEINKHDPVQVVKDPKFWALDPQSKYDVLMSIDPEFVALKESDRRAVVALFVLPTKEECLRVKNLQINNLSNALAAAVVGLYGFAGGFGVWAFYRLVRFAFKG